MKLCVGEKVLLNTAAGLYWSEIVEVVLAHNAAFELCEWYVHQPVESFRYKSRFNEYMANQLVMEVK
jgi:hypothetical protein